MLTVRFVVEGGRELRKLTDMDNLDCEVCFHQYDEDGRQPRNFPCGHTLCTACIDEGIEGGQVSCPFCQEIYNATAASTIPLNVSLLKVINAFSSARDETPNKRPTLEPELHAGICSEHGSYKLFWCSRCEVWVCRNCTVVAHPTGSCPIMSAKEAFKKIKKEEDKLVGETSTARENHVKVLKDFMLKLNNCKVKHQKQVSALMNLTNKQNVTINLLQREGERVLSHLQNGEEIFKKMISTMKSLTEADSVDAIISVRRESQICRKDMKKWIECSTEELAKCDILDKSEKLQTMLGRTRKIADVETIACLVRVAQQDYIGQEMIRRELSASDLTAFLKPVTIWAVLGETSKAAPITLDGQCLRVPSLRNAVPPKDAIIVPYAEVWKLIGTSTVAFMEISSLRNGHLGSVHIETGDDCEKDESFLRRFTGESTPLLNSKMIQSRYNYNLCCGGDDSRSTYRDLTEPTTLHNNSGPAYVQSTKGFVTLAQLRTTTCFIIWYNNVEQQTVGISGYRTKIGKVSKGLDVVEKASREGSSNLEITDCGILIKY